VQSFEFAALKRILSEDIPHLRRQATPSQPILTSRSCLDEDCFLSSITGPEKTIDLSQDHHTAPTGDHYPDSNIAIADETTFSAPVAPSLDVLV